MSIWTCAPMQAQAMHNEHMPTHKANARLPKTWNLHISEREVASILRTNNFRACTILVQVPFSHSYETKYSCEYLKRKCKWQDPGLNPQPLSKIEL